MTQRKRLEFRKPRRPSGIRRERRTYDDGPRYETGLFLLPYKIISFEPPDEPVQGFGLAGLAEIQDELFDQYGSNFFYDVSANRPDLAHRQTAHKAQQQADKHDRRDYHQYGDHYLSNRWRKREKAQNVIGYSYHDNQHQQVNQQAK